ncbi:unnamed protein product, partial [Soboliphyme baturini]|uniref:RxLR effector protein n=1 Tax=Soboliphyme baturini TaxID=241478 RepID=A0A183JAA2_9BILA
CKQQPSRLHISYSLHRPFLPVYSRHRGNFNVNFDSAHQNITCLCLFHSAIRRTWSSRPPVDETANLLKTLLNGHGKNFMTKFLGPMAKDSMSGLGGVDRVAVALSESPTITDFASAIGLSAEDTQYFEHVLKGLVEGNAEVANGLGFTTNEVADMKFYVDKLRKTGFFE